MTARFRLAQGGSALLLGLLASCAPASSLETMKAEGNQIVFAYTADRAADAERQASLYCANLGLGVRLRETRALSDRVVATFECRPSG
jgi:hypothetical protein